MSIPQILFSEDFFIFYKPIQLHYKYCTLLYAKRKLLYSEYKDDCTRDDTAGNFYHAPNYASLNERESSPTKESGIRYWRYQD